VSGLAGCESHESIDQLDAARDERLVVAVVCERHLAFAGLAVRRQEQTFRAVLRITRNREDAEDAMQDAWMRAFIHIETFDGRAAFSTWFTRIAINSALMILRKRKGHIDVSLTDCPCDETREIPAIVEPSHGPDEQCLGREKAALVREAVRGLPASLGTVVESQYSHEMSIRDMATSMGISVGATKSRLKRARAILRERLSNDLTLRESR
jgi:RNA polymerase sigma factor (sigma-70 family)